MPHQDAQRIRAHRAAVADHGHRLSRRQPAGGLLATLEARPVDRRYAIALWVADREFGVGHGMAAEIGPPSMAEGQRGSDRLDHERRILYVRHR
jgi:hypothetical protein